MGGRGYGIKGTSDNLPALCERARAVNFAKRARAFASDNTVNSVA